MSHNRAASYLWLGLSMAAIDICLMTELTATYILAELQHGMCIMTKLPATYCWASAWHVSHDRVASYLWLGFNMVRFS